MLGNSTLQSVEQTGLLQEIQRRPRLAVIRIFDRPVFLGLPTHSV